MPITKLKKSQDTRSSFRTCNSITGPEYSLYSLSVYTFNRTVTSLGMD